MKIGYPCINTSIGCTANSTFRLKNYSPENLKLKLDNNLDCLLKILKWNVKNNIYFFRISSDLVPFASHPICKEKWWFNPKFKEVGEYINKNNIRINMHPDQFIVLNAKDKNIVKRAFAELKYHQKVLKAMKIKGHIQLHVGGVYGDKESALKRFKKNYKKLGIKEIVVENDHKLYSVKDCLELKLPIVFDSFHHECLNNGETRREAFELVRETWKETPFTDYSSQGKGSKGSHSRHINKIHFKNYLKEMKGLDFDIMLEIKDKEKSVLEAMKILK